MSKVARTPDAGLTIMKFLRGFRGGQRRFTANFLAHLFTSMKQNARGTKHTKTIWRGLMRGGLPEILPDLISPKNVGEVVSKNMMLAINAVLDTLGSTCIPRENQKVVARALTQYINDNPSDVLSGPASSALSKMALGGAPRKIISFGTLSDKLVGHKAREGDRDTYNGQSGRAHPCATLSSESGEGVSCCGIPSPTFLGRGGED